MSTKKTVLLTLLISTILASLIVYSQVSAPRFYTEDGKLEWTQELEVVSKEGILPVYRTKIGFADRTGKIILNGETVREAEFVTFRIWNGYQVRSLTVSSVSSGEVIFKGKPWHVDTDDLIGAVISGAISVQKYDSLPLFFQSETRGERHYVMSVRFPLDEEELRVQVTDRFGNVTSGVVRVSPDT